MLHAFHKGINTALGKAIPVDAITTNLRKEFITNYKSYQSFRDDSVNVLVELERLLSDPLRYYNSDTSNFFLIALGKAYNANIVVYKSNSEKCWITDYTNEERASKSHCILKKHCRSTLIQYYQYLLAFLMTI